MIESNLIAGIVSTVSGTKVAAPGGILTKSTAGLRREDSFWQRLEDSSLALGLNVKGPEVETSDPKIPEFRRVEEGVSPKSSTSLPPRTEQSSEVATGVKTLLGKAPVPEAQAASQRALQTTSPPRLAEASVAPGRVAIAASQVKRAVKPQVSDAAVDPALTLSLEPRNPVAEASLLNANELTSSQQPGELGEGYLDASLKRDHPGVLIEAGIVTKYGSGTASEDLRLSGRVFLPSTEKKFSLAARGLPADTVAAKTGATKEQVADSVSSVLQPQSLTMTVHSNIPAKADSINPASTVPIVNAIVENGRPRTLASVPAERQQVLPLATVRTPDVMAFRAGLNEATVFGAVQTTPSEVPPRLNGNQSMSAPAANEEAFPDLKAFTAWKSSPDGRRTDLKDSDISLSNAGNSVASRGDVRIGRADANRTVRVMSTSKAGAKAEDPRMAGADPKEPDAGTIKVLPQSKPGAETPGVGSPSAISEDSDAEDVTSAPLVFPMGQFLTDSPSAPINPPKQAAGLARASAAAGTPALSAASVKTAPSESQIRVSPAMPDATTSGMEKVKVVGAAEKLIAGSAGGGQQTGGRISSELVSVAAVASSLPVVHNPSGIDGFPHVFAAGESSGRNQLHETNAPSAERLDFGSLNHTTLLATPNVLEVGVTSGTNGWLRVRAEMDGNGGVSASVVATTASAVEALHKELPALSAYLKDESVGVSSLVVNRANASVMAQSAATGSGPGSFGPGGFGAGSDAKGREGEAQSLDSFDSESVDLRAQSLKFDASGTTLAGTGYGSRSGGWLNVVA